MHREYNYTLYDMDLWFFTNHRILKLQTVASSRVLLLFSIDAIWSLTIYIFVCPINNVCFHPCKVSLFWNHRSLREISKSRW